MNTTGERLREARKTLGLTQRELAKQLGITPASLSDIERGKIKSLTTRNLMLLSATSGLNPQWLANGEGPMFIPEDNTEHQHLESYAKTLDYAAAQNGLTDIEFEVLRLYMRLDPALRQDILKELIAAVSSRVCPPRPPEPPPENSSDLTYMEYFDKKTGRMLKPSKKMIQSVRNAIDVLDERANAK